MSFFRNPQTKKSLILHLALTAVVSSLGFMLSTNSGIVAVAASLVFIVVNLLSDYFRFRKISELNVQLDQILHCNDNLKLEDFDEGELSVLKNEINKLLSRLREQGEALQKDKSYLADSIADISHQIRTPLTSVSLIADMLSQPHLQDKQRLELTEELTGLLLRIDWLITSLLKISRLDAETVSFRSEEISVSKLIEAAAKPLMIPMDLKEISFSANADNAKFVGDFEWSTEALSNILKNCIEHIPPKGTLTVTAIENPIYTEINVQDSGCGFDKEDMPHLFERFYKGKSSSKNSIGIGLALCRMIVAKQNGTVKAANRHEGGAEFTLRFYKSVV